MSDFEDDDSYFDMDGEDRNELHIRNYGIDMESLQEELRQNHNIYDWHQDLYQHPPDRYGDHIGQYMNLYAANFHTSAEIFSEIELQVIKESPTLRLHLGVEYGDYDGVENELERGLAVLHGSRENILEFRLSKIGGNEQTCKIENRENMDPISLLIIDKCPSCLDTNILIEMANKELLNMFKHTLLQLDLNNSWKSILGQEKKDCILNLFKAIYIDKPVNDSTMIFIPVFKELGVSVGLRYGFKIGYELEDEYHETKMMNLFDKFVNMIKFQIEKSFSLGWYDITAIHSDKLLDKSICKGIIFVYSLILANLCDYGVNINEELVCFDEHDWNGVRKTFVNYLYLRHQFLLQKVMKKCWYTCKKEISIIEELLVVCANKRVNPFVMMNNNMLSGFIALPCFQDIQWMTKRRLILETVLRWKQSQEKEDQEWLFQKSLRDQSGKKCFSSRGRRRNKSLSKPCSKS